MLLANLHRIGKRHSEPLEKVPGENLEEMLRDMFWEKSKESTNESLDSNENSNENEEFSIVLILPYGVSLPDTSHLEVLLGMRIKGHQAQDLHYMFLLRNYKGQLPFS
jgi:hypothetical protein